MVNTWYFGECTTTCFDMETFELQSRTAEGIETMDQVERDGWFNELKQQFINDVEGDTEFYDIRLASDEYDLPDNTTEKCVWKWVHKKDKTFNIAELTAWKGERY